MAKLYVNSQGGSFYDAFGGKIGEVEQVWLGDSFNRDSIAAFNYCAKGIDSSTNVDSINCAVTTSDYVNDSINQLAVKTDIASLSDKIKCLELSLESLKESLKKSVSTTLNLRGALKTLQYEREVK